MCKLQEQDPSATGAPQPVNTGSPMAGITGPEMAPGAPVMKETKLAKLLKIALPIIKGGAVGATSGNWRVPGSGGEAANQFFQQQIHRQLAQKEMNLRLAAAQSQEKFRQSEEERNRFYDQYLQSRTQHEQYLEDHPKPEPDRVSEVQGYPGLAMHTTGSKAGTTFNITRPQATNPDGTLKDYSGYGAQGEVPLGPPESEKQLQMRQQETEKEKKAQQDFSEKQLQEREAGEEHRLKVREAGLDRREANRPGAQKVDKGKVETYATEVLKAAGNDPQKAIDMVSSLKTMDADMKSAVQDRIGKIRTLKGKSSAVDDAIAKALARRNKAAGAGQTVGVPTTP